MSIESGQDLAAAVALFHRRYSVPCVGILQRDGPAGFADLQRRTGASRHVLAETLRGLAASGVIGQSGTASRPVYSLSSDSRALGDRCLAAMRAVSGAHPGVRAVALKKWPMVVLVAIGPGEARFSQLRELVAGITSRTLTDALKDLMLAGLVQRSVEPGFPPGTHYRLTPSGHKLLPVMQQLVGACASLRLGASEAGATG